MDHISSSVRLLGGGTDQSILLLTPSSSLMFLSVIVWHGMTTRTTTACQSYTQTRATNIVLSFLVVVCQTHKSMDAQHFKSEACHQALHMMQVARYRTMFSTPSDVLRAYSDLQFYKQRIKRLCSATTTL